MRILSSKKALTICIAFTYGFLLILNILTQMYRDDYQYLYSWNDGSLITSVSQIFPSMYTHGQIMNGRILCHFWVQFFLMLPGIIFDLLNAAAFVCLVYCGFDICTWKLRRNILFFLILTGFVWTYSPAFGQTCLWLDGSINYLWAFILALSVLRTFWKLFVSYEEAANKPVWKIILFCLLSWYAGGFAEMSSLTMMTGAVLFLLLVKFYHKNRIPVWGFLSLISSIAGFLFMFLQPGEQINRVVDNPSLITFLNKFIVAVEQMDKFLYLLLILWCVLFTVSIYCHIQTEKLCTSTVFFLLCLAANVFTIAGSTYPDRVVFFCTFYLILADCILLFQLAETNYAVFSNAICAGFAIVFLFQLILGSYDVLRSFNIHKDREQLIYEQIEAGVKNIEVENIKPRTKYSVLYGTEFLNETTSDIFPNSFVAKYYGIDSILGYPEDSRD